MAEIKYTHLEAVLETYGREVADRYKSELDMAKANATYNLKNSVQPLVEVHSDRVTLFLQLQEYWKYLEYGTRKAAGHPEGKRPPFRPFLEWVKDKPVIPWSEKLRTMPLNKAQEAMAAMIRWKVWKEGTKPLHLLEKALGDQSALLEECREALSLDLEDYARQVINEITG